MKKQTLKKMKPLKTIKRTVLALLFATTLFIGSLSAQNDTMYVMKSGVVVGKYNVNTQVDSVLFHQPNFFIDSRDGNVYRTVTIGTQVWMAENLSYLPSVVGPTTSSTSTPYFYVYGYNGTNVNEAKSTNNYITYGVLYNWPAAMNGSASSSANPSGVQGVCPTAWHLPSDAEWTTLITYLGGNNVASGKLKETGIIHWNTPNTSATNESGFTALPGGSHGSNGTFGNLGYDGYWLSTTENSPASDWYRLIAYNSNTVGRSGSSKELGLSIRCIKD